MTTTTMTYEEIKASFEAAYAELCGAADETAPSSNCWFARTVEELAGERGCGDVTDVYDDGEFRSLGWTADPAVAWLYDAQNFALIRVSTSASRDQVEQFFRECMGIDRP